MPPDEKAEMQCNDLFAGQPLVWKLHKHGPMPAVLEHETQLDADRYRMAAWIRKTSARMAKIAARKRKREAPTPIPEPGDDDDDDQGPSVLTVPVTLFNPGTLDTFTFDYLWTLFLDMFDPRRLLEGTAPDLPPLTNLADLAQSLREILEWRLDWTDIYPDRIEENARALHTDFLTLATLSRRTRNILLSPDFRIELYRRWYANGMRSDRLQQKVIPDPHLAAYAIPEPPKTPLGTEPADEDDDDDDDDEEEILGEERGTTEPRERKRLRTERFQGQLPLGWYRVLLYNALVEHYLFRTVASASTLQISSPNVWIVAQVIDEKRSMAIREKLQPRGYIRRYPTAEYTEYFKKLLGFVHLTAGTIPLARYGYFDLRTQDENESRKQKFPGLEWLQKLRVNIRSSWKKERRWKYYALLARAFERCSVLRIPNITYWQDSNAAVGRGSRVLQNYLAISGSNQLLILDQFQLDLRSRVRPTGSPPPTPIMRFFGPIRPSPIKPIRIRLARLRLMTKITTEETLSRLLDLSRFHAERYVKSLLELDSIQYQIGQPSLVSRRTSIEDLMAGDLPQSENPVPNTLVILIEAGLIPEARKVKIKPLKVRVSIEANQGPSSEEWDWIRDVQVRSILETSTNE